jgi:hypothetical protein
VPPERAQTAEERRAVLDRKLNDSLRSFDARLRKEQQRNAQERDAHQATVAVSTDAGASPGTHQTADAAEATTARPAHARDLKSDRSDVGAGTSANGNGALADEIPDGNDDDIVARRLHKAAEQETDPELKDKLWQEYVEYKKNAQVR